ncbi:MAG TPA: primosomal protein N' [Sedimentisphaerales bacterium]|nr:primosomal protein N' [Sedimentisphaerales bacterium]
MRRYAAENLFESAPTDNETCSCSHIIRVAFDSGVDNEFDYLVPDRFWPVTAGQRVQVPFGRKNKPAAGFCVQADIPPGQSYTAPNKSRKLKKVTAVLDSQPLVDEPLMKLAKWVSTYYICPLGQVLAAMVPSAVKKGIGVRKQKFICLAQHWQQDAGQIKGKRQKQIVEMLKARAAFEDKSAVELQSLLHELGCTEAPVSKLAERLIIRITQKSVLKSLPVIPEPLAIKPQGTIVLNDDQKNVLDDINARIDCAHFAVTLLHGVTDSGKTEVYIRAVQRVIKAGRAAIVLLPEIALTAQTVQRFSDRFDKVAVMHSQLTAAQRNAQWQKIKTGHANVVIGARSAVFAPVSNLGLIVVDEEHETSYKQDTVPRYNARDVAIKRAQLSSALCILGSATPSLETLYNCGRKKHFSILRLPTRVMNLEPPRMKLVNLQDEFFTREGVSLISGPLADALEETLARKEQAILLLNRRGYSHFVCCRGCRHVLRCRNCDVTLTFHKSRRLASSHIPTVTGRHIDSGFAMCHYCGAQTLVAEKCPLCGARMLMIGFGSQRLQEELEKKFPDAHAARIDSDSMAGQDYYRILKDFAQGRIDILAGTQMLAKGLHFPNVTLVGVISADTWLNLPDFRSNERTFQLISQVAGRAGRSFKKGTVFVQTFLPGQAAIKFAMQNDYEGFTREELRHRKALNLPPFWRLAVVIMRDRNFDKLTAACNLMRRRIDQIVAEQNLNVRVRGPIEPLISRVQRFHRMYIVVQAPDAGDMLALFTRLRRCSRITPAVDVAVDIDPAGLL